MANGESLTTEEMAAAYAEVWVEVLDWSKSLEVRTEKGEVNIKGVLLLPLPSGYVQEVDDFDEDGDGGIPRNDEDGYTDGDGTLDYSDADDEAIRSPDDMEFPEVIRLAETLASFCEEAILVQYVPENIQWILFPKSRDDELFPEHSNRVGFHLRRGGYPTALLPLRESNDGMDYMISPYVLGHELGEIIYTNMLREEDGSMGFLSLSNMDPLREGFCEVIGIRFYNFVTDDGVDYDYHYRESYKERDIIQLFEADYNELSFEDQQYLEYIGGGTMVNFLVERYGLKSVLKYFYKCAEALRKEDEELAAALDDGPILGGTVSIGVASESKAQVVDNEHLKALLTRLGYEPDDFPAVAASTRPPDARPEGVIAIILVEQFYEWFGDGESKPNDVNVQDAPVSQDTDKRSFIEILSDRFQHDIAREVFGEEFDFNEVFEDWKNKIAALIKEYDEGDSDD
jgi:hypothetical protein